MIAWRVPRGVDGVPHHVAALGFALAVVEATTGALLAAHYVPTPAEAHASVRRIVADVPFGDLLRAVHVHGAGMLVATAWLLVLATALSGGYQRPRAGAWCATVTLAALALYEGFTGSVLPWSRDAAAGAQIATATVGTVPGVGSWLRRAMLGGDASGAVTQVRVWAAHSALIPGLAATVVALAALARRDEDEGDGAPRVRHFSLRASAMATAAVMVLVVLAALAPPAVGAAASATAVGGSAPWYLGAAHALLRLMPARVLGAPGGGVAVLLGAAAFGGLLALPWLDPRGSRVGRAAVLALAALVLGGTVYARL